MFNKIKKNMPTGIITVGFIIYLMLTLISEMTFSGEFSYHSLIMSEYFKEVSILVLFECIIGGIIFKIFLKKEKSLDHDSQQK